MAPTKQEQNLQNLENLCNAVKIRNEIVKEIKNLFNRDKNSIAQNPLAYRAYKYTFRFLTLPRHSLFDLGIVHDSEKLYDELCAHLKGECFDTVFSLLSAEDWCRANVFFKQNPNEVFCGYKNNQNQKTIFSYVKFGEKIYRRAESIGEGSYGRVKTAVSQDGDEIVIKRIKPKNNQENEIEQENKIKEEADINLDLGIAETNSVKRNTPGNVKYFQGMKNLGSMLSLSLKSTTLEPKQQLDYAIQLLLLVNNLHQGHLSKTKTLYVHRDIKPDNICLKDEKLHLIDFGFASKNPDKDFKHSAVMGTRLYMPKDYDATKDYSSTKATETPNYFFDDTIATLRTIHHPNEKIKSIISPAYFKLLPPKLQTLLDTSSIQGCIDRNISIAQIAAVFIVYQAQEASFDPSTIENIKSKAETIIEVYSKLPKDVHRGFDMMALVDIYETEFKSLENIKQTLSVKNIPLKAFFPFFMQKDLQTLETLIGSITVSNNSSPFEQACQKLSEKFFKLKEKHPDAAKAVACIYLQIQLNPQLNLDDFQHIIAPHQERLKSYRGVYQWLNRLKDLIRQSCPSIGKWSMFKTDSEKLLDKIEKFVPKA